MQDEPEAGWDHGINDTPYNDLIGPKEIAVPPG
jgi:hypothetical protein